MASVLDFVASLQQCSGDLTHFLFYFNLLLPSLIALSSAWNYLAVVFVPNAVVSFYHRDVSVIIINNCFADLKNHFKQANVSVPTSMRRQQSHSQYPRILLRTSTATKIVHCLWNVYAGMVSTSVTNNCLFIENLGKCICLRQFCGQIDQNIVIV